MGGRYKDLKGTSFPVYLLDASCGLCLLYLSETVKTVLRQSIDAELADAARQAGVDLQRDVVSRCLLTA